MHTYKKSKGFRIITKIQKAQSKLGIVVNERGELFGLVTMHDIGESLIGEIP